MKIGHLYVVQLRITHKTWYPDQKGTEETAHEWTSKTEYPLICLDLGIIHCAQKVEELIIQDHGKLGVHDGIGRAWKYVIDKIVYGGEVRM